MNIVVFSKNRAMQLDALLYSLKENLDGFEQSNTTVIWAAVDQEYQAGYLKCQELYPNVIWRYQDHDGNFKGLTITAIDSSHESTMFLVDDIVFKEKFSLSDKEFLAINEDRVLCLSLRLYPGITYCYPTRQNVQPPTLTPEGHWNWSGCEGDWGYPMSVDGHVFKTNLIKQVAEQLDYNNPNEFEGAMSHVARQLAGRFPEMVCYMDNSRLLNIPANRVQDQVQNRVGDLISPEMLNGKMIWGYQINTDLFRGYKNKAPHEELPYQFLIRKEANVK